MCIFYDKICEFYMIKYVIFYMIKYLVNFVWWNKWSDEDVIWKKGKKKIMHKTEHISPASPCVWAFDQYSLYSTVNILFEHISA